MLAGLDGFVYKEQTMTINPGDKIYLYTDGVPEATDLNSELFGDDRLKDCINRYVDEKPKDILLNIKKDIDEFVGEAVQFDDITMLLFDYKTRL